MRTIQQMVQSEVLCCMSSMVSTLAGGYGSVQTGTARAKERMNDLADLCEQAFELASPVADYEEAAVQAGWSQAKADPQYFNIGKPGEPMQTVQAADWQELCEWHGIEPYDREVFEHWAVTDWFADKLIEEGEKVDKDFAGLCVWARTTTGQAIYADGVVERIYAATHQPEPVEG